jgi:hypothetical protein
MSLRTSIRRGVSHRKGTPWGQGHPEPDLRPLSRSAAASRSTVSRTPSTWPRLSIPTWSSATEVVAMALSKGVTVGVMTAYTTVAMASRTA